MLNEVYECWEALFLQLKLGYLNFLFGRHFYKIIELTSSVTVKSLRLSPTDKVLSGL